ncbi:MAG: hypothetical protein ACJ8R9_22035 [Steroidobacteraceae bacterium]
MRNQRALGDAGDRAVPSGSQRTCSTVSTTTLDRRSAVSYATGMSAPRRAARARVERREQALNVVDRQAPLLPLPRRQRGDRVERPGEAGSVGVWVSTQKNARPARASSRARVATVLAA